MHLVERYSLDSSSKIDKPFIYQKFYPLVVDKFITFQPVSKYGSKNYDYWADVLFILEPILKKSGIQIVQIGGPNEKGFDGIYQTQGQTNLGQVSYIIDKGLLHLGADSFGTHMASYLDKKIVTIYSNNFVECVKPYWGDANNHILLEPERNGQKPSFSAEENPKTINTIKPEKIAEAVCKLLNLDYDYPFETVYHGAFFTQPKMLEMVPDFAVNVSNLGVDTIIARMDFNFDETILANQLRASNCVVVTDRPISESLILQFRDRIKQVVYDIKENNDPKFAMFLNKMGINFGLISTLPEETLNKFKLDYLDIGLIHRKDVPQKIEHTTFSHLNIKDLYYRTNKVTLGRQKIYNSKAAWLTNVPSPNFVPAFMPAIDSPAFFEEIDYLYIVKIKN